jgi:hypothetical protein
MARGIRKENPQSVRIVAHVVNVTANLTKRARPDAYNVAVVISVSGLGIVRGRARDLDVWNAQAQ